MNEWTVKSTEILNLVKALLNMLSLCDFVILVPVYPILSAKAVAQKIV